MSLMLCSTLVAIDSTIISTAVPSIVSSIGGFSNFPWLFSTYVLAQAVTAPVYGRVADIFGRKPVMLFGVGLFLLGSILCGAAWSMGSLIGFRVLQGIGAGAIGPMSITIAGDTYSVAERARVQGYLASVWAISSIIGPTLGGVFSEYVSWRWIFFVNIPVGTLAVFMFSKNFKESFEKRRPRIDYAGAILLTAGSTLVILGVLEGGQAWPWASSSGIGVPVGGILLLIAFVFAERRAAEPTLPLWVFRRRLLATTSLASLFVGAILLGLSSYVPTFVQDVLGSGPLVAGLAVGAFTFGWPLSSAVAGRIYTRVGFRSCAMLGGAIATVGCVLLALVNSSSSILHVGAVCFLIGVGMGLTASPTTIAAQASVGWSERGVVTSANLFFRSIGSALGVAVFGAIANASIGANTPSKHPDPVARAALIVGTHHVFVAVAIGAALLTAGAALMPRGSRTPAAAATVQAASPVRPA